MAKKRKVSVYIRIETHNLIFLGILGIGKYSIVYTWAKSMKTLVN